MTGQGLLCGAGLSLLFCMVNVFAQEDLDCKRYLAAGLACPSKPAAERLRLSDPAPPAGHTKHLPGRAMPVVPAQRSASAARDAAGLASTVAKPVRPSPATLPITAPLAAPVATLPTLLQVMPRAAPLGSLLTPLAGRVAPLIQTSLAGTEDREPGEVIVYWHRPDEADAALAILAKDFRIQSVSSFKLEHLGGVVAVFRLETQSEASQFRDQLARDYPGLAVDFHTRYRPFQLTNARIYLPLKIDLPQTTYPITATVSIRIGMIDGPVSPIAALINVRMMRKNFLSSTDTPASADHATVIAALIAGQDRAAGFVGVAPQASLYSAEIMRLVGKSDMTSSSAMLRAIDWLLSEKVQVINLSLGGPGDAVMARAFARLSDLSVITVAAVGNGGPDAKPAYPAAYPGVIAVTATDALDAVYSLANQGAYITLAAPGVDLWVPDAGAGHYVSGTSYAAAVVTAASARLIAQRPQHSAQSLQRRLCRNAKDLGGKGFDHVFGCGLIQVNAALSDER